MCIFVTPINKVPISSKPHLLFRAEFGNKWILGKKVKTGTAGFPLPQMNRCLIGSKGTAKASCTASGRHFLEQGFLPATTGASALIKEQEDAGHLKETAC